MLSSGRRDCTWGHAWHGAGAQTPPPRARQPRGPLWRSHPACHSSPLAPKSSGLPGLQCPPTLSRSQHLTAPTQARAEACIPAHGVHWSRAPGSAAGEELTPRPCAGAGDGWLIQRGDDGVTGLCEGERSFWPLQAFWCFVPMYFAHYCIDVARNKI